MLPTGIRVASEDVTLPPDMGDLSDTVFNHRVVFLGDEAVVAGGYRVAAGDQLKTWKIVRGETSPIQLGNLVNKHHCENPNQGMTWIPEDGKLHLAGAYTGSSTVDDILDIGAGTWSQGEITNTAGSGLSCVSMIKAEGQGNNYFASAGANYSVSAWVIATVTGSHYYAPWDNSPIGGQRPYGSIVLKGLNKYIWWPAPVMGTRIVRIDTTMGAGAFTTYAGLFDATYSTKLAACVRLTKGTHDGKYLISGGNESNIPASAKTWLLDLSNEGAPTTTQCQNMLNGPRIRHTMHELPDGRVAIIGGCDAALNALDTVEIYDPESNTWEAGPVIPGSARMKHASATTPKGNVLLVGGHGGTNAAPTPSNRVDYLYKDGSKWIKADW